jgi:pyruvate dehydrogenase complex dehydrogenase (E1) component
VVLATLKALAAEGKIDAKIVQKALKDLEIHPEKKSAAIS